MGISAKKDKKIIKRYLLLQMCYWASFGAFSGFQAMLFRSRGFDAAQISILMSLRYVSGIFAQPMIGTWADNHKEIPLKKIIAVLFSLSVIVNTIYCFTRPGMLLTIVMMLAMGVFELNAFPLLDSVAVQYINAGSSMKYSIMRSGGSVTYAICSVILGVVANHFGIESVMLIRSFLVILTIAVAASLPALEDPRGLPDEEYEDRTSEALAKARGESASHSIPQILRANPRFTMTMFAFFFSMIGLNPLSSYISVIVPEMGGTSVLVGWALFFQAMSELPAAVLYLRMRKKMSNETILFISICFISVRILFTRLAPNLPLLIAAQATQMLGYGLFLPSSVFFTAGCITDADRVRGQSIMGLFSSGLSGCIGILLNGWTQSIGGVSLMLNVSFGSTCIAILLGYIAFFCMGKKETETKAEGN